MGKSVKLQQVRLSQEDMKILIEQEEDFVFSKKFDFSLKSIMEKYPEGCSNKLISSALMIPENEVESAYGKIIEKLRKLMKVEV